MLNAPFEDIKLLWRNSSLRVNGLTHLLIDRCTTLNYDLRAGRDLYRATPAVKV